LQYFYLFINIGALVGQIGMTYSEKVGGSVMNYEKFMLNTAHLVRRVLARLHASYRHFLALPYHPVDWTKSLRSLTANWFRSGYISPALEIRCSWALEYEPREDFPTAHC
jgi:hypothetical protein